MIFKPSNQVSASHSSRNTTKVVRVHAQNYDSTILIGNTSHLGSKQEQYDQQQWKNTKFSLNSFIWESSFVTLEDIIKTFMF